MRPVMVFIRKVFGDSPLVGAEIGVAAGDHAQEILEGLNIKKLYLIDIWEPYLQNGEKVDSLAHYHKTVIDRFSHCENVEILKKHSAVATLIVPDNLDFVYIDASHDYENIKKDIACWYLKVRIGGILAGHDYFGEWSGIVKAVDEFVNTFNYELHKVANESIDYTKYHNAVNASDWWITKK